MTEEDGTRALTEEQEEEIQRLKKRLDSLDRRLDNIDSMVTAVAERIMNRPVSFNVVCPHCGKSQEIALIGSERPGR